MGGGGGDGGDGGYPVTHSPRYVLGLYVNDAVAAAFAGKLAHDAGIWYTVTLLGMYAVA